MNNTFTQRTFVSGWGERETVVTVDIPDAVIEQAVEAAHAEDRIMVVGQHPQFGWVYRDADDVAVGELATAVRCDSTGLVD